MFNRQRVTAEDIDLANRIMLGGEMEDIDSLLSKKLALNEFLCDVWRSDVFKKRAPVIENLLSPDKAQIEKLYQTILGRNCAPEEILLHRERSHTIWDVFETLCASEEFENHKLLLENQLEKSRRELEQLKSPDERQIAELYSFLLGRPSTQKDILLHQQNHHTLWDIIENICKSDDFNANRKAAADEEVISKIYEDILGRRPEQEEIQLYRDEKKDPASILEIVWGSEEYRKKKAVENVSGEERLSSEDMEDIFDFVLERSPRNYERELFAGETPESLLKALRTSEEYQLLKKSEVRGTIKQHYYGAMTYKIMWDEPAAFTCVYDGSFNDLITSEVKKGRAGVWQEQYQLLKNFSKNGFFLDIGANIGVMSCMYASKGWSGFAIEASPKNVKCLKKAVDLNNFDVGIGEFAVSSKTQKLKFLENGPWSMLENTIDGMEKIVQDIAFENVHYETVQAYALDDWKDTAMCEIKEIDFIKLDVEGAEMDTLRGMKKFLSHFHYPPFFCESNGESLSHFGYTTIDLKREFEALGYQRYAWKNGRLYLSEDEVFQIHYCIDYVFLKGIPDHLLHLTDECLIEEVTAAQVRDLLQSTVNGPVVHACSELRNYKYFLEDPEIKAIIDDKKRNGREDVKNALAWYSN